MVEGWSSSSSVEAPEPKERKGILLGLILGGLVVGGLFVAGMLWMFSILEELDEFATDWEEDPDDRVEWRMDLAVSERGWLRDSGRVRPEEKIVWLYCIEDDLSVEGSMLTDNRLVSWWLDDESQLVEEEYLSFDLVERLVVDWSDDESWHTFLTAIDDDGDELVLWLAPTDGLDSEAVYEAHGLLRQLNSKNYLGLTEEP